MLFTSFAHRLLLAFGLAVVSVIAVVAVQLGLFGDVVRAWMDAGWAALFSIYEERQQLFDNAFKLLGFSASILGAAWTIHRGWHYAERNLPDRLNELNARWKATLDSNRHEVSPALHAVVSVALPNAVEATKLQRLLRWFHDPDHKALANWQDKLSRYKSEYRVLRTSRARCRSEVVTAHLAVGTQLSQVDRRLDALDAFEKALAFNRTNLDALEMSARQAYALNLRPRACGHLEALAAAAGADAIRKARALRFHAEILHEGQRAEWEKARDKLTTAINLLSNEDVVHAQERDLELALAGILLSDVQITRERFWAARSALAAAEPHLAGVGRRYRSEVQDRFRAVEGRLIQAERERDNPEIAD